MGLAEKVAKMRMSYHLNAIEVNNVLNQLHIRGDEKAEQIAKDHVMTLFNDIFPRLYGKEALDAAMAKLKERHC